MFNYKIIFKSLLLLFFLIALSKGYSQDTLVLDQTEFDYQNHCAATRVHLQPGYSYSPIAAESMHSYISVSCIDYTQYKYARLREKLDGSFYIFPASTIWFKYDEKYRDGNLEYKIYEFKDQILLSSSSQTITKTYGTNWISLPMCLFNYQANHFYTLEVTDEKGRIEYLRFYSELEVSCVVDPGGGGGTE